jgi:hypothetical protein
MHFSGSKIPAFKLSETLNGFFGFVPQGCSHAITQREGNRIQLDGQVAQQQRLQAADGSRSGRIVAKRALREVKLSDSLGT